MLRSAAAWFDQAPPTSLPARHPSLQLSMCITEEGYIGYIGVVGRGVGRWGGGGRRCQEGGGETQKKEDPRRKKGAGGLNKIYSFIVIISSTGNTKAVCLLKS